MKKMKRKKKKKTSTIFLILFIIIMVILISILGIKYYKDDQMSVFLNDNLKIEINTDVMLYDFVYDIDNGEIITENRKIDTSKLGKQKLEILIKKKTNKEEKFYFEIDVVDTTKPVIAAKDEITTFVGKDVNLLKDVTCNDNSNEEILVKVSGEYDINKIGEYKLTYEATDSSGNNVTKDFVLKVIKDNNNYTFTTSKGFKGEVKNGVTYIDGVLIANKTYALPSSYGQNLTSTVMNAFNKMKADAQTLNLNLYISSGYRRYSDQKIIYNNYVKRDGKAAADTYSARPGHSEHQTGLAFDLNIINDSFADTPEAIWLNDNCYRFGFILRYPKGKDHITGYKYESWHFRYVGIDLATKLYNNGDWITLEEHFGIDSKYSY